VQQLLVVAGAAEVGNGRTVAVVRAVVAASRSVGSVAGQGTSGVIVRIRQKTDIA
jgi:hypothetical protein